MAGKSSAWSIRKESAKVDLNTHRDYIVQSGEVMFSWNELQNQYQALFSKVVANGRGDIGSAAWHTLVSDQAQRDMLEAVLVAAFERGIEKKALLNMRWALKETRKLASYRNIAAHMPVTVGYKGKGISTIPNLALARAQAAKIVRIVGYKELYKLLTGELYLLAAYVGAHHAVLYGISPGEFPRRLRLHDKCQLALNRADQAKASKPKPRRRSPSNNFP